MAKGMDEIEVLRLKTIVEKSASPWEPTGQVVKNKGTYRLHIRHKRSGRQKLLSSHAQWLLLIENVTTNPELKTKGFPV